MVEDKVSLNEIVEKSLRIYIDIYKDAWVNSKIRYSKKCDIKRYNIDQSKVSIQTNLYMQFVNMVCNSIDALIEKFGKDNLKRGLLHIKTYKNKEYDVIEIKDNGVGMNEKAKKRFFEENYTTKPEGSGLGFIGFENVLKELNGYYELESEVGKGTKFKLYFNPS